MDNFAELEALDRCDRCGARAAVAVELTAGVLMFCAHHARELGFQDRLPTQPTAAPRAPSLRSE